jgi:hypothetical protein
MAEMPADEYPGRIRTGDLLITKGLKALTNNDA